MDEVQKYLNISMIGGMIILSIGVCLNIAAAVISQIALWQILEWLAATAIIISFLFFFLYWWIRENNVS